MSSKRTRQKSQTRERILEAAKKVYSEQGFSAPASAISSEAGVANGSVFVHFPTVENLLLCLLDSFSRDICDELHALYESRGDVHMLLNMHIDVLIRHENFYRRLITQTAYLPEQVKNTFIAIQSTVSIHFLQTLEPQILAGNIKGIPLHMLFNTWLGLVHYYLINGDLFAPHGSVLTCHRDTLIESFMALIQKY